MHQNCGASLRARDFRFTANLIFATQDVAREIGTSRKEHEHFLKRQRREPRVTRWRRNTCKECSIVTCKNVAGQNEADAHKRSEIKENVPNQRTCVPRWEFWVRKKKYLEISIRIVWTMAAVTPVTDKMLTNIIGQMCSSRCKMKKVAWTDGRFREILRVTDLPDQLHSSTGDET